MPEQPNAPRPIIIDTDPGPDDASAILAALASEDLEVLGITAVAGNVPLELTARNALILVELAGRPEIPVFAGCDRPLRRNLVTAEHVHGKTGIDGAGLPDPTIALQPQSAVDWMAETLLAAGEREITSTGNHCAQLSRKVMIVTVATTGIARGMTT